MDSWRRTEGGQTKRVGQQVELHDHVTQRVAQSPLELLSQLQGADAALLPHIKADQHLWH